MVFELEREVYRVLLQELMRRLVGFDDVRTLAGASRAVIVTTLFLHSCVLCC